MNAAGQKALLAAVVVTAAAAGACFVIGGALGLRQRDRPRADAAYVLAGLVLLGAAVAAALARDGRPGALAPLISRVAGAPGHGPADPAAYEIAGLIAEATAITREAAAS